MHDGPQRHFAIGPCEPAQERDLGTATRRNAEAHAVTITTTFFDIGPTWHLPDGIIHTKIDGLGSSAALASDVTRCHILERLAPRLQVGCHGRPFDRWPILV